MCASARYGTPAKSDDRTRPPQEKPPRIPHGGFLFLEGSSKNKTAALADGRFLKVHRVEENVVLGRTGSDLLFQVLRLSTIGAGEFYGRVRDGIGYRPPAKTTSPAKNDM